MQQGLFKIAAVQVGLQVLLQFSGSCSTHGQQVAASHHQMLESLWCPRPKLHVTESVTDGNMAISTRSHSCLAATTQQPHAAAAVCNSSLVQQQQQRSGGC